ncbi:hypothetical protein EDF67_104150 [Sphingobacterium sp. JUb78]|nr:hypothetical protein [Sphingobacterium kitahiroshimense]TCR11057.1 hypothetical protein EDF67_104150 [Sphingobacterium sp. JUb78]
MSFPLSESQKMMRFYFPVSVCTRDSTFSVSSNIVNVAFKLIIKLSQFTMYVSLNLIH